MIDKQTYALLKNKCITKPNQAEVGQVLTVKSVDADGRPIDFECGEGGSSSSTIDALNKYGSYHGGANLLEFSKPAGYSESGASGKIIYKINEDDSIYLNVLVNDSGSYVETAKFEVGKISVKYGDYWFYGYGSIASRIGTINLMLITVLDYYGRGEDLTFFVPNGSGTKISIPRNKTDYYQVTFEIQIDTSEMYPKGEYSVYYPVFCNYELRDMYHSQYVPMNWEIYNETSKKISIPSESASIGDTLYVSDIDKNGKPIAWSYSKPSSIEVYDTQSRTEFKSYTGTLNGYNFLNSENKVEHKAYRIDSSTILVDDVSHALNINDYILITSTENSNYCMIKRIDNENIVARFFVDKEMVLEKNLLVFEKKPVTIYGFHINSNESNPSNAVTYLEDAVGMTPAYMNYTTGQFDYGSWEDAFFMPRPCMLKSDGTVDYYLDPNDYSKKADGTASDIANTSYDGNAMMEWGKDGKKIWLKVVPDTNDNTSASIYIADEQDDDEYTCYNFVGSDGVTVKDHFYTPIYQGSLVSSKLRSLSGRTVIQSNTANNEVTYATANGTGWYTECWCDMELLQDLLVLISKSLDTQTSFGNGGCNRGSSASYMLATGTMNTKGLFWGSSSTSEGVKVFGMENLWGNQYRRFAGFVSVNGTAKIKKCFGTSDGSTTATYNFDGTGYKSCGTLTNSGGYLSKINFSSKNNIPIAYNGSSSTYYCDYAYANASGTYYAYLGGYCDAGLSCGAFYLFLDYAASISYWSLGASLSFR